MKPHLTIMIFLVLHAFAWGQEVNLDNLNQYIEFWPSEIKMINEEKLSDQITIPKYTRSEILEVTKNGVVVSNPTIRNKGYLKYTSLLENSDFLELVKQNILANRKYARMEYYLNARLMKKINGQRQNFKLPVDKKYLLLYFSANWCQPCHQTIELVKKFLSDYNLSDIQPILISAADKTDDEYQGYIQKHTPDWPYVRFSSCGVESPILYNFYQTNNPKGTIPQFVLIDRAGRILANFRSDEKPFEKIRDIVQNGNPLEEKQLSGTLHPEVRYIEFDQCSFFREGYCYLKKGDKYAVINAKGEMVRNWYSDNSYIHSEINPYFYFPVYDSKGNYIPNTVKSTFQGNITLSVSVNHDFAIHEGLIIYSDNQNAKYGYMKPNGEKVTPPRYTYATPFINGKAIVSSGLNSQLINRKFEVVNANVEKSFNKRFNLYSAGNNGLNYYDQENATIALVSELIPVNSGKQKYGFCNQSGTLVIPYQFDEASVFSEGLACVGTKDEFGEMQYGYINTKGKYIVDPIYRFKPGDFHCGRAVVFPRKTDDTFRYGYINTKGELVIKVKYLSGSSIFDSHDRNFAAFYGGYAHSILENNVFIDTIGTYYDLRKYPIFFGNGQYVKRDVQQTIINHNLIFRGGGVRSKYGLMDLNGKIILPAVFDNLSSFDPYSGLAFAIFCDNKIFYTGFINEKGQFVLLKKEDRATW